MTKIDTGSKFKMAAAACLKTHINRHNSAKFACQPQRELVISRSIVY